MGIGWMRSGSTSPKLLTSLTCLSLLSLAAIVLYKVDDFASQTRTVVGHNLEPTPWHDFKPKIFEEESREARNYKILSCSYLSCRAANHTPLPELHHPPSTRQDRKCPGFFRWIHHDLLPWNESRITINHVMEAKKYAAFRVIIVKGRLYADLYYACVQSRTMFTLWSILQLLQRYPGMVPDVDLMFDCMDRPTVNRTEHDFMPLPIFRYCTSSLHFDIPFPDWSFWGWPETNLRHWPEEFEEIKQGSQRSSFENKIAFAYWKGNPDVSSPIRTNLLQCNDTEIWGAQILRQNWAKEIQAGFGESKLSDQCNHRYKIYAEGYAWSVSLKYIISCGCVPLIITTQYDDFFSRGLTPLKNYWPVSTFGLCESIKFAVDWGNSHPTEAEKIGRGGQRFMEHLSMDMVYDYMFYLISEYAKLLDFKPEVPSTAQEVCRESLMCFADPTQREFMEDSATSPSPSAPCYLQPANGKAFDSWVEKKQQIIQSVRNMEDLRAAEIRAEIEAQRQVENPFERQDPNPIPDPIPINPLESQDPNPNPNPIPDPIPIPINPLERQDPNPNPNPNPIPDPIPIPIPIPS